ncbi:MAG TPA: hypothetical protein VFE32_02195 [Puia sp.]|jgi:hypothetical protein|nr:hypothetical protein [Puia sp.]
MRRSLLVIFVLFTVTLVPFAACNKNDSTPTPAFNVSASINGTPMTFNAIITVDTISTPGTVYIVAHSDSANLTPLLEITLSHTPLKTGTYPFADSAGGLPNLIGYTLWDGGNAVQYPAVSDTVTLTKVTPTWFSGAFQGTCEYSADSVVSVTNGKFTVGYQQY